MTTQQQSWSLPKERLLRELGTNPIRGLNQHEVRLSLSRHGPNRLTSHNGANNLKILLRQFQSPLLYILFFAAIFSGWEGSWSEVVVILLVAVLNGAIGFLQERKAEHTMASLRKILSPKARVIRDGIEEKIDADKVVIGDVIKVEAGDRVPADARIIESQGLRVNQASLTGESVPAHKKDTVIASSSALIDRTNMLYMSTLVVSGQATAAVSAIGMKTEIGSIAREVSEVKELPENLQQQLAKLGRTLVILAAVSSLVALLIGLTVGVELREMVKVAISLLVSIIPEGLPVAVTVILSVGLLRLSRRGAIVRKLTAAETLGSTTIICVDKTGTLTEGKMMVEKLYAGLQELEVTGDGYELSGRFKADNRYVDPHKLPAVKQLLQLASLATVSTITERDLRDDKAKELTDPTETSLSVVAAKAGYYAFSQEKDFPEVLEIPFDQELRYSASVHQFGKTHRYIVKGAAEKILSLSEYVIGAQGKATRLLTKSSAALEEYAHQQASQGFRLVALAYSDYPSSLPVKATQVKNLTFVGFFSIADPIRRDAGPSITKALKAGVQVMMITGDHLLTASSIGRKLGLVGPNKQAIHADELGRHDLAKIGVIARATPSQKLQIVERLQRQGQVVAMTGDGVNDAPALKKADIGIAMGRSGTDVAVEAAEMVLTSDSFGSIVEAIGEGRLIWENIKKAVFLLVSTCLADAALIIITLLLKLPLVLLPVQILWLNLVTDGLTAMALTTEPAEQNLMRNSPKRSKQFIAAGDVFRMILLSAVMAICSVLVFRHYLPNSTAVAQTMVLTSMVFFQLFNLLNIRSSEQSIFKMPFLGNPLLLVVLITSAVVHLFALAFEPLRTLLGITQVGLGGIGLTILVASSIVVVDELRKLVIRLLKNWALKAVSKGEYTKANEGSNGSAS